MYQVINGSERIVISPFLQDEHFHFELEKDFLKKGDKYKDLIAANACVVDHKIYITTRNKEYPILQCDKNGNVLKEMGHGLLDTPHCIFPTSSGTLLCTDSGSFHVIQEIDTSGNLLRTFGTMKQPSDSGYDPDAAKKAILAYHLDEVLLQDPKFVIAAKLDSIRKAAPPFNKPTEMIRVKNGSYFASDGYRNAAIHHFDASGNYEYSFGAPGRAPGQFRLPHCIMEDAQERLWVADRENDRVQVFDHQGNLLAIFTSLLNPSEICCDENYIYIGESDGGITVCDYDYHIVSQFGHRGSILRCHGFCKDEEGNFYISALWINGEDTFMKLKRKEQDMVK